MAARRLVRAIFEFRHFASKSEEEPYVLFPAATVDDREQSSAVSRSARQ